jgi:hypothetical protein
LFLLNFRSHRAGKRQQQEGESGASVFNNFADQRSDQTEIPPLPYVVNWTCDDQELNSSAFNDVFIEDNYNYCTTENDYDSKYGGMLNQFTVKSCVIIQIGINKYHRNPLN